MARWDLRRARIEWDWGAGGLWFDNRAYAKTQRRLADGSVGGPPKRALDAAASELARVTESTRAELERWNLLGEELLGASPPRDVEDRLSMFYAEKQRLAELVAEELGPDWTVGWTDCNGVERECSVSEGK